MLASTCLLAARSVPLFLAGAVFAGVNLSFGAKWILVTGEVEEGRQEHSIKNTRWGVFEHARNVG